MSRTGRYMRHRINGATKNGERITSAQTCHYDAGWRWIFRTATSTHTAPQGWATRDEAEADMRKYFDQPTTVEA